MQMSFSRLLLIFLQTTQTLQRKKVLIFFMLAWVSIASAPYKLELPPTVHHTVCLLFTAGVNISTLPFSLGEVEILAAVQAQRSSLVQPVLSRRDDKLLGERMRIDPTTFTLISGGNISELTVCTLALNLTSSNTLISIDGMFIYHVTV
jgi:hypothetical protein